MADKYENHRQLLETYKHTQEQLAGDERQKARLAQVKMHQAWLERIFSSVEEGKPIVYSPVYPELIYALDLQPLFPEAWELLPLRLDMYALCDSIDTAHEVGIHADLCSFGKSLIGSLLLGKIPPPAMIVAPTFPCDNLKTSYQVLGHLSAAPTYFLDAPYWIDADGAQDYWLGQFKGLISFLEEHSGKRLDYDRLEEVVEESNRMVDYWRKIMELRKLKPLPQGGIGLGGILTAQTVAGLPVGTEAMKLLLDDIQGRIERKETAIANERVRVIWFHIRIPYDREIWNWMGEMGAAVPVTFGEYSFFEPVDTSTRESIIKGLAQRALEVPMLRQGRGAVGLWIEDCLYAVKEWQGDCVILAGHAGCKWIRGGYGLLQDALREHGIPLLMFDIDFLDPRVSPPEEYRGRIEDFLSTVMAARELGRY